jgi:glucose-1-phosphate cytidylyltransferase
MKVVLFCGGYGVRMGEETRSVPKPMIEIGGKPILWHIMKIYSAHGVNEFVICCGYKGYQIKEYFANYFLHVSDVTFDVAANKMQVHENSVEPWKVTLVDTGETTNTGGRLKRVAKYLGDEPFCFTYGDGVADVDVKKSLEFFRRSGKLATVTAVQPAGRFGVLSLEGERVARFEEKPRGDGNWTNGGFFVLSPKILKYIKDDQTNWESEVLSRVALDGELAAYQHRGFWHPMDTQRDKIQLEELWQSGRAPWKIWK